MGPNLAVGQMTVSTLPTNTNMVTPYSGPGQPTSVQPTVSQSSWGYTYPRNQSPTTHQNYQPKPLWVVYPRIPYPGNTFTPWGKPNWSNVPMPRGPFVNIRIIVPLDLQEMSTIIFLIIIQ